MGNDGLVVRTGARIVSPTEFLAVFRSKICKRRLRLKSDQPRQSAAIDRLTIGFSVLGIIFKDNLQLARLVSSSASPLKTFVSFPVSKGRRRDTHAGGNTLLCHLFRLTLT